MIRFKPEYIEDPIERIETLLDEEIELRKKLQQLAERRLDIMTKIGDARAQLVVEVFKKDKDSLDKIIQELGEDLKLLTKESEKISERIKEIEELK